MPSIVRRLHSTARIGRCVLGMPLVLFGHAVCLAADNGHAAGRPPLREDLPFWGILTFIAFLWVCKKLLWDWWLRSMSQRERSEAEAIETAERENRTAAELLGERIGRMEAVHEEVRELLAEARRDAETTKSQINATARSEAQAVKSRTLRDIDRRREQALKEIFDQLTSHTIDRARERLATGLSDDDHRRLIDESLGLFRQQAS